MVAHASFRAGEIEAWGRGIERILGACHDAGAPDPQLEFDARDVWVTFPFSREYLAIVTPPDHRRDVQRPEAGTNASVETPVETPVQAPVQTPAQSRLRTPERIVAVLSAKPEATLTEVAQLIGKSLRAVERAATTLTKQGRLRFVGPKKGGHWDVLR